MLLTELELVEVLDELLPLLRVAANSLYPRLPSTQPMEQAARARLIADIVLYRYSCCQV